MNDEDSSVYRVTLACGHEALYRPKPAIGTYAYCYRCTEFHTVDGYPTVVIDSGVDWYAKEIRKDRWYARCRKCRWHRSIIGNVDDATRASNAHQVIDHQTPQLVDRPNT